MRRRTYLRGAVVTALASGLAGCSDSDASATATRTTTATEPPSETDAPTPTATATTTPTPGDRSLDPYRSWLVAPTPVTPHAYEFTHLSLAAVREDASTAFADQLDTYWRQRTGSYFGFALPVDAIDAVLTVNHSRVAGESFRVAGGAFDPPALRSALADAGFTPAGRVDGVQRFVRTRDGRARVVGLHPDLIVSIGADAGGEDEATPLERALSQHVGGDVRPEEDDGLAALIDYLGSADYVTGRALESEVAPEFPLSEAVATGRRLDVRETTSWAERAYVFPSTPTVERAAFEDEIRKRHVGQPVTELSRDGRIVTVAGAVENSLIRLI